MMQRYNKKIKKTKIGDVGDVFRGCFCVFVQKNVFCRKSTNSTKNV